MELHPSKLTFFLLWCVFRMWAPCVQVRGDAVVPESCSAQTSKSCQAMIGYTPVYNFNLSQVASLFSLNYSFLLGPNDIDPSLQNLSRLVFPTDKPYLIPQTCGCSKSGMRVVTTTTYTVVSGNILLLISDTLYSGLVTYQEIATANGISNPDLILTGQEFTIPIQCACFNQSDGSQPAIFLSYQIQKGDTLSSIAQTYNTSEAHLQELNSLSSSGSSGIVPTAILFVPLPVCKANFSSGAFDKDLTVVKGKYELTANDCVVCNCDNGTMQCIAAPSSLGSSCSNITCPGSNIALGESTTSQGNGECTVQSCVYKGYNQSGIIAILETEHDSTCPVALPPETFYKPPTGLVASPLPTQPGQPATTTTAPPPPSTPIATAPTAPTTTNPSSASSSSLHSLSLSGAGFLLVASFLL